MTSKRWILSGSPENFPVTQDLDFRVIHRQERAADCYPWRLPAAAELVLDPSDSIPAETLVDGLAQIGTSPLDHWKLAPGGSRGPSRTRPPPCWSTACPPRAACASS